MKKNIIFIELIFAVFATLGLVYGFSIANDSFDINSPFVFIIFIVYSFLYNNKPSISKSEKIFCLIISILLSVIVIIGSQLEYHSCIIWSLKTLLKIVFLYFSIFPLFYYLIEKLNKISIPQKTKFVKLSYRLKIKIFTFVFILIGGICGWLALFPGLYGYDAGYQIMMFLEKLQLTTNFSIVYSYILTFFVKLGKNLFDSYQIGFAIYSFVQMIFLTYVATRISYFVYSKTNKKILYIITVLFFCGFPLYLLMILSSAQDTLFGGLFALIILNLFEIIDDEKYFDKVYKPFFLAIEILMLCLTRNNGFYALIISLIFLLVLINDKKKLIVTLMVFLAPLVTYKIIVGPIYKSFGIIEGNTIREMLSVPSQQLARVYNYNKKAYNENDIKKLKYYYLDLKNFDYYTYRQSIADPVKSVINQEHIKNNFLGYIKFWTNIGLKDPKNYIEAVLLNTLGYWYPNKTYQDDRMYHPYIEYNVLDAHAWNKKYLVIKRNSKFPLYEKRLSKIIYKNEWKNIPLLSTVFTMGTYFILFIFTISYTLLKRKYNYLLPLGVLFGLVFTLFLSPVALFRYFFPIVILWPVLVTIVIKSK